MFKKQRQIFIGLYKKAASVKSNQLLLFFLWANTHLRKTEKVWERLALWVMKRLWFTVCTPHYFTISSHRSITIYAHTVIGHRLHTDTVKCLFPPGNVMVKGLANSSSPYSTSFSVILPPPVFAESDAAIIWPLPRGGGAAAVTCRLSHTNPHTHTYTQTNQ